MKNNHKKNVLQSLFPDLVLKDADFAPRGYHDVVTLSEPPVTLQTDPADDIIFAAGPKGFPSSDLSVSRRQLQDPSLLIASQKYQRPVDTGALASSSDDAFESLRFRHESDENYMDRLRSIIGNKVKNLNTEKDDEN